MHQKQAAVFTALCRVAIGAGFLGAPKLAMRPWIGAEVGRPPARLLARALGTRDIVLGLGTMLASSDDLNRWLTAALAADTADLLLTIVAREHLPRKGRDLVAAIAGGGVVLGAAALLAGPRGASRAPTR